MQDAKVAHRNNACNLKLVYVHWDILRISAIMKMERQRRFIHCMLNEFCVTMWLFLSQSLQN